MGGIYTMPLRFFTDKNGLNDKTAELPDAEMRMEYAVIFKFQLATSTYRKSRVSKMSS